MCCNDLSDERLNPFFTAVQNLPVDAFGSLHTLRWIDLSITAILLWTMGLKVGNVAWQGILTVKDQVVGELALFGINLRVRRNMRWIDDCHIQASLHCVVQEDTIQDGARMLFETEGDVTDA